MRLQEQINLDLKKAMIERDDKRKEFLRVVIGEMGRGESKSLNDASVHKLLRGMRENALMLGNKFEVEIIDSYLPRMKDDDETREIVKTILSDNNISSLREIGKVMSIIRSMEDSASIDNGRVSKILKEILA